MSDEIWWCSFASEEGPLGVVVIPRDKAEDIVALARRLWMLGINPGGEMFADYTSAREVIEADEDWLLDPINQGRLVGPAELSRRGYPTIKDVNPQGFDHDGFQADMDSKTIQQEEGS